MLTRTQLQDMDDVALIEHARQQALETRCSGTMALLEELANRFEPFAVTPDGYSFTNHRKFPNPPEEETTL